MMSARASFMKLKTRLITVPILNLPSKTKDFVIYNGATSKRLGCMLMQHWKVVAYASRQLRPYEKNYLIHDLMFAIAKFEIFTNYKILMCRFNQT